MNAVHKLLDRLPHMRSVGPNKWRGPCPAHGGRSQSLAIAEADGRVLLHCFSGCDTVAVLGAIGLAIADLFDRPLGDHPSMQRSPWSARDALDLAVAEAMVVAIIAGAMLDKTAIGQSDWNRLAQAAGRLNGIALAVRS